MYKIGFLGVGKMGSAILNGIIDSKLYKYEDICIYTPNLIHKEEYLSKGVNVLNSELELFLNSKIILLAIKPQIFSEALKNAIDIDFENRCVISIAAGISIEYISKYFNNATIVRVMPNTPALINLCAATITANYKNELYYEAKKIFESIGIACEVLEEDIDNLIPINGSMPAYLYLFAKAFIENGFKRGIDYDLCKSLCAHAIIGSAEMLLRSNDDIDTLINNVCSKKGTTIEGLEKLYKNGFVEAIDECYSACVNRSKELNK